MSGTPTENLTRLRELLGTMNERILTPQYHEFLTAGIIVSDEHGVISYASPEVVRMFGYDLDSELEGKSLTSIMPEEYRERHLAGIARVKDGGPSSLAGRFLALEGLRRDGTAFPIELRIAVKASNGARLFVGRIRDASPEAVDRSLLEIEQLQGSDA